MLPAVRRADAQAGHVRDVRRGDLDDLGPGPAADGQLGPPRRPPPRRRCPRAAPGAPGAPRTGAEPSTTPHAAFALPRPRSGRRCAWPHHQAPPVHGPCARGERGDLPCTADSARSSRCTVWASQAASRCAAVGSVAPVCPARVRRASALVRRVRCPACWCSSHSVRRDGGSAVHRLVLAGETVQFAGDGDGAGAEQVHHVLGDPADLGAVPVGPRHHDVAERGQPGLQGPVGDRGDAEPLAVQGAGVQGPPRVVGAVAALDPVPDRDVHVQLRVAVAGQVVQEQAGDQAAAVPPLPRPGGMVPGPGVGSVAVQPATASRADSSSASSSSSARASNAAAWSSSPRSRACRAATR